MAKAKPTAFHLANYRRPLDPSAELTASEKRQLTALLEPEGLTLDQASADEELIIELVDVIDHGDVRYQLYLFGAGTGAIYEAGTTKLAANIVEHCLDLLDEDADIRSALAAAWERDGKRLRMVEAIDPSALPDPDEQP